MLGVLAHLAEGGADLEGPLRLQAQQHGDAGVRDAGGLPDVQVLQMTAGGAQNLQHPVVASL